MPPQTGPLSLWRLAWRHLRNERESSAGIALALVLALLPAGLLVVESSGADSDLRAVVATSAGVTVERAGVAGPQALDAFQLQAQAEVTPTLGRFLDTGSARITASPYHVSTINSAAPTGPLRAAAVSVTYVADLANRVDVREGLLAHQATSGGELTVSMPMNVADRAGIHLFDLVCIGPAADSPVQWCARVTGLWRPSAGADPRWTAAGAPFQLFTDRDELFALTAQQPPRSTLYGRQFRPRPGAIAPRDALTVQGQVADLRTTLTAERAGTVTSALDTDLARYAAARRLTSFPLRLLSVALIPLSALLVVVLARWYVDARLHDLALLRARGWSRSRVQMLVLAEFGIIGASAVVVGVTGLLALAWVAGGGSIAVGPLLPNELDPLGVLPAAAIPVLTTVVWCNWLARWASMQSVLQLDHPEARASRVLSSPIADSGGLLVLPAALLLLLPRLIGMQRWLASGTVPDLAALVLSVAGLAMLAVAALPAMSLVAETPGRRRLEVEWTLAHWQLRRWWQRHAAAGFVIVFAFAVATFAAIALVNQVLSQLAGAAGRGDTGGLAVGFVSALGMALLAYGLVFLFAVRARIDDYTALLVDGVPVRTVQRSLLIEQGLILGLGLVVGLALGLVLALSMSAGIGLGGTGATLTGGHIPAAALAGVVTTLVLGVPAGIVIARRVRRTMLTFRLFERAA